MLGRSVVGQDAVREPPACLLDEPARGAGLLEEVLAGYAEGVEGPQPADLGERDLPVVLGGDDEVGEGDEDVGEGWFG